MAARKRSRRKSGAGSKRKTARKKTGRKKTARKKAARKKTSRKVTQRKAAVDPIRAAQAQLRKALLSR